MQAKFTNNVIDVMIQFTTLGLEEGGHDVTDRVHKGGFHVRQPSQHGVSKVAQLVVWQLARYHLLTSIFTFCVLSP